MMLIPEPDLLIADEPTSALDVSVQAQVLDIIDDLVTGKGMGLILISHDLNLVSRYCDRILVMNSGEIVEECAAGDLHKASHPYTRAAGRHAAHGREPRRTARSRPQHLDHGSRHMSTSAIHLDGLSVNYGPTKVVHDVSFSVAEGESFALVGESGSGKSTILKAISGLAPDWTGTLSVLGKPRGHAPDVTFAETCQMVFQDPYGSLHPRKTVDSCLAEPLAIHGIGGRDARVREMLAAVGLDQRFRFRFPHQLSGGQRQRSRLPRR